jgi:hypothetical protein
MLDDIKQWPIEDFNGLIEQIGPLWSEHGTIKISKRIISLITGGWSGNEDIIGAMQENVLLWTIHWKATVSGGLYVFKNKQGGGFIMQGSCDRIRGLMEKIIARGHKLNENSEDVIQCALNHAGITFAEAYLAAKAGNYESLEKLAGEKP